MAVLFSAAKALPAPIAIFLLACVVHFAGSWALPLIDRDEPRFAEASREMRERGDLLVPWFNNTERFDKPPLIYWLQMGAFTLFGENRTAARLPSALAAAATAAVLFVFSRRFITRLDVNIDAGRAAWWTAAIFTLSLQTLVHAKAAVADMAMILCVTVAYWCAWECAGAIERRRTGVQAPRGMPWWAWAAAFHMALGFGFLAKGPVAWLPLVALFWHARIARASTAVHTLLAAGFLLCLGIVAVWGIPALIATEGRFFDVGIGKHVVERGFVAQEGHGSSNVLEYIALLPFFFVTVFASFFPWSIQLPWLVRRAWKHRFGGDSHERALWAAVIVVFLVFSLYKTKLPHYTLPAFPLMALLMARHWFGAGRRERLLKRSAVGMLAFLAIFSLLGPLPGSQFASAQLEPLFARHAEPGAQLGSVSYKEPSLVWSFRKHNTGWHHPLHRRKASRFLGEPGPRILVLPSEDAAALLTDLPESTVRYDVRGLNVARGEWVDLAVFVKPGGDPPPNSVGTQNPGAQPLPEAGDKPVPTLPESLAPRPEQP